MIQSPLSRTRRSVPVLGLVLALATTTAGCSSSPDGEPPTESPGASATTPRGEPPVELEADGLPTDFPRDEVSVVDGDIVSVQEPTARSGAYNLLVYVGDIPRRAVVEQAVVQLEDAGWSLETSIEGEPPPAQVLTKSDGAAQRVIITNSTQGEESAISYTVEVQE